MNSILEELQKRILSIPYSKLRITDNDRLDYPETIVVCSNRRAESEICNHCVLGLSTDFAISNGAAYNISRFYLCDRSESIGKAPFKLPPGFVLDPYSIDNDILFRPSYMDEELYKRLLPAILSIYENKFTQEIDTDYIIPF